MLSAQAAAAPSAEATLSAGILEAPAGLPSAPSTARRRGGLGNARPLKARQDGCFIPPYLSPEHKDSNRNYLMNGHP